MTEIQFAKQFLTTLDSKNNKYQADHVFDPRTFQTRTPYTLPKLSHPPHPLPPKTSLSASPTIPTPGSLSAKSTTQAPGLNLSLKSTRNPTFTLKLPSLPSSTSIFTLKTQIQSLLSSNDPPTPLEKIKILHNKKPIPATKSTISDVLSSETEAQQQDVEFGVMVIGGAPDPTPSTQTIQLNNEDEGEKEAEKGTRAVGAETVEKEKDTPMPDLAPQKSSEPVQPGDLSGRDILQTGEFWDDLQGFLEQRLKNTAEAARVRGLFENAVKGGS